MKLHAQISNHECEVHLQDEGSIVLAEIEGRAYELRVQETAEGLMLNDHGLVFDCRLDVMPESGKAVDVMVGTRRYTVTVIDPRRLRSSAGAGMHGDEAARIVAPMPGKVVRLLVSEGEEVEAGSGVVVVEAMKMQNEMRSPRKGRVVTLKVAPGETVNAGQVLAMIE